MVRTLLFYKSWPYSIGKLGNIRFIVSLIILYIYYHAFDLFNTSTGLYSEGLFYYVFPAIFGGYLVYDIIKNKEYLGKSKEEKKDLIYRAAITLVFFLFFLITVPAYYYLAVVKIWGSCQLGIYDICKPVFIGLFLFVVILYRIKKIHKKTKKRFKE